MYFLNVESTRHHDKKMQKLVGMMVMIKPEDKKAILEKYLFHCMDLYQIYYNQHRLTHHDPNVDRDLFHNEVEERSQKLQYKIDKYMGRIFKPHAGVQLVSHEHADNL